MVENKKKVIDQTEKGALIKMVFERYGEKTTAESLAAIHNNEIENFAFL